MLQELGLILILAPVIAVGYAYAGYPAILSLACLVQRLREESSPPATGDPETWPTISISLPAYNEEARIRETLEALLSADYPSDCRQIVVISDASTDRTDEIVREFSDRGVELIRLERRSGKTAAENAAASHLRGEIVINTDASVRVLPHSIKPLVRAFQDPTVGVASGRDVSVRATESEYSSGESGYVGYEMWLRSLESRLGSIVGASGCFYAIRQSLHRGPVPPHLSRDFLAVLRARDAGFRSVSVSHALVEVPRAGDMGHEFRRKVRTMARGLQTLWYKRGLLNPLRHGAFAVKLWSHKLMRWLGFLALPLGLVGLLLLGAAHGVGPLVGVGAFLVLGFVCTRMILSQTPERVPRILGFPGYVLVSAAAGVVAWAEVLSGATMPIWEPTRRSPGEGGGQSSG